MLYIAPVEKSQELQAKIRHVAGNLMEGDSVKVAILQKALAELIGRIAYFL